LALATYKAFHYALLKAIVTAIAAIGRTTDRHDDHVASAPPTELQIPATVTTLTGSRNDFLLWINF